MRTITMTPDQTARYDKEDAVGVVVDLSKEAIQLANQTGEPVSIVTNDGRPVATFNPR